MVEPELTNELARRQWQWLCDRCGEQRAREALRRAVARGRRPYPLNAARELSLRLPPPHMLPPLPQACADDVERARARLRELHAELKRAPQHRA